MIKHAIGTKTFFPASNKCQLHAKHHNRCEGCSRKEVRCCPCPLENKYSSEEHSLKWTNEGSINCSTHPDLLLAPRACQVLSKFTNCAHSTPLAWNVLPLIPYTAASYLSPHKFLREALPSHPNQMELLLASVSLLAFVCFLQSTQNVYLLKTY